MVISIRARLVVEGNVQGVGYRSLVKQVARRMKIKGKVKNLDDGSVEIYCESDRDALQKFVKAIHIKSKEPANVFALNVEKIDVKFEGEKGYIPLEEGLGVFEIEYGEEAKLVFEKANLERLEIGSLILSGVGEKVDTVGEKVDVVGGKIDAGFSKTDSNFKDLDVKYDVVSKELKSINQNMSKLTGYVGELVEEFTRKKKPRARKTTARL